MGYLVLLLHLHLSCNESLTGLLDGVGQQWAVAHQIEEEGLRCGKSAEKETLEGERHSGESEFFHVKERDKGWHSRKSEKYGVYHEKGIEEVADCIAGDSVLCPLGFHSTVGSNKIVQY